MELLEYQIQEGDTLELIAEKFKISINELINYHNSNSSLTKLISGDYLPIHLSTIIINPEVNNKREIDYLFINDYKIIAESEYYTFKKLIYTSKTESIVEIKSIVSNTYEINQKSKVTTCSSPHYDSYLILLSLLDKPFENLIVSTDHSGKIVKIVNQTEIEEKWEIVKIELNEMTDDKEMLKQIIETSRSIYSDSLKHIVANIQYNQIFPQLFENKLDTNSIKNSHSLELYSSLFSGNKIWLKINTKKIDNGEDSFEIKNKSFLENKNKDILKDLYDKTYRELLGNNFEYDFSLRSKYKLDKTGHIEKCLSEFTENINDTIVSKCNYEITKI